MKKIFTLMTFILSIFAFTLVVNAAAVSQTIYLKATGSKFDGSSWKNVFKMTEEVGSDPTVWHLVYTGKEIGSVTSMQLTFTNGEVFNWVPSMGFSTNNSGNNPGWVIIAPYGWQIAYVNSGNNNASESYLITNEAGNGIGFNVSGYHPGSKTPDEPDPRFGSLTVQANVLKKYTELTFQPYRQKTLQEVRQLTLQPVWQKELQPIWQKFVKPYLQPTFKKAATSSASGTLVTRLEYTSNLASATPVNGGTFGNGMTWLKLTVADLEDAVPFTIADSSYNSNGKKTPSEYNKPIAYEYYVRVEGENLIVSFDERLISASVTAKIYGSEPAKHDPSGHKTITTGGEIVLPLPKANPVSVTKSEMDKNNVVKITLSNGEACNPTFVKSGMGTCTTASGIVVAVEFNGNGVKSTKITSQPTATASAVYLFVHLEAIQWYTNVVGYEFVEWVPSNKDPKVIADIPVGLQVMSDEFQYNIPKKDRLIETVEISDILVRKDFVGKELITEDFATTLSLVCTNDVVATWSYTATIDSNTLVEVGLDDLVPGNYTCTIDGGRRFGTQTITVEVIAEATAEIIFDGLKSVSGKTVKVDLDDIYLDAITLTGEDAQYLDPITLHKIYLKPIMLDKVYRADIELEPIKLGNETDAFDPNAIRLN